MIKSLEVPTATSFREVPAKLLEVNRSIINGYLGRTGRGKVSFTHLIGFAVVQAITETIPAMNASFVEGPDGKPRIVRNPHLGLGLAVDVEKANGRTLLVVCIKDADTLDFRGFWSAYDDLIRKVRNNKLTADDFAGVTVSLTNPGTIGTVQSVPRLMPGQGVIVGVGSLDYPTEFQGADPATLATLGVSKIITISSTYDHRIIQGAESGLFLKRVHELLLGADGFYEEIFRSIGVPYEAAQWRRDVNPVDQQQRHAREADAGRPARQRAPRARPPHRRPRPAVRRGPGHAPRARPRSPTGSPSGTSTASSSPTRIGGHDRMPLGDVLHLLRDAYCRTIGIEYMHIQEPAEKAWIQHQVERRRHHARRRRAAPHPRAAQRGRGAREVPRHQVPRAEALRHRRRRVGHPDPRLAARRRPPTATSTRPSWAWPTAAGSTCS